ncbi:MAG TPA: hypothetical protein P5120_16210, partial [Spirochaetota bacterium]|nr:hypothetical protein [Spirochaetota bacterium]
IIAAIILLNLTGSSGQGRIERSDKKKDIALKAKQIEERGSDHLGFSGEILAMLENSCGIKCRPSADDYFEEIDRSDAQAEHVDTFSIFSGGLSLRHALQLERVTPRDDKNGTIDPASLSSPVMKQIPYSSMLRGRKYSIYNIDRYTPADFYYLHFSDAGKASDVITYIEDSVAALSRRISPISVDYRTRSKVVTLLAIKEGAALNKFYSSVIDEMVITGSDPFIIEGSDITLIIRPANRQMLEKKLDEFRREYKYKYSCEEKGVTASGVPGKLLTSRGGVVHSYMFTLLDGTVLISNSLKASEAVIDTVNGRRSSLAEAPDYLYMRSIFPASPADEDGFLYISDLFVKHLSSPLLKIVEARRMKEIMRMSVLEKYAVYYFMLNGRRSSSVEEIAAAPGTTSLNESRKKELAAIKRNPSYSRAKKLDNDNTADWGRFESVLSVQPVKKKSKKRRRGDTGAATLANAMKVFYRNMTGSSAKSPADVLHLIDMAGKPGGFNSTRFEGLSIIDGTFTAMSDVYGRSGLMTPCIDIEAGMATTAEAENYKDFARDYSRTGEAYISPAGIKFKPGGSSSAEAFVYRTGENPFYSLISAFAGGEPVSLHPDSAVKGDVLSIALKLDPSAIDRYLIFNEIKARRDNGKEIGMREILSGELQLHMGDSLPPAGFNSSALRLIMNGRGYGYADAISGLMVWSLLHPVRITIPVRDNALAEKAIESIKKQLADKWNSGNLVKCNTFSFQHSGSEINVLRMTLLGSLTARIYSTVKNGTLHIATTEKYIKSMLEPQNKTGNNSFTGNAAIVIRPSELTQEKDMYRSGFIEEAMFKSMKNFGTIKLMSLIYPDAPQRDLPELTYRDFGFTPVCPLAGEYLIEKQSGDVYSSVFGGYTAPSIRSGIKENGATHEGLRKFFSTTEIRGELQFMDEGMKLRFSTR